MRAVFVVNNVLQVNAWKERHIRHQMQSPGYVIY